MNKPSELELYLLKIVRSEVEKLGLELKEREAKQIVNAIMPQLDTLVSKRVKQHFIELADFIKVKFKDGGD